MAGRSRHLVDPELLPGIGKYPNEPLRAEDLQAIRASMAATLEAQALPDRPDISLERRHVRGPDGAPDVEVLVYRPTSPGPACPAICYMHGGGYVFGSASMMTARHLQLAHELDCIIVSVNYRLAPETPHPGPIEDCYATLAWMHDNASDLGIDPNRIAVSGHSAGGGLAACLAILARDRGRYRVCFQHLMNPMLDDRTVEEVDPHPFAGEFVWTRERNRFAWQALLGTKPGAAGISPYAAASRVDDPAGLPPTFISVGALDLFAEEDLDYARRLSRAGVPVEFHLYPGTYHGSAIETEAWMSQSIETDSVRALRRALNPANPIT